MRNLSERLKTLLIMGLKATGTMEEAYDYIVEELYLNEADEVHKFCEWVDKEIGGCSGHNIDVLFKAFKNPDDHVAFKEAMVIRDKIREIRSYMSE